MDSDKVLFELDNIMYSHGCEVHNASKFDPDTDTIDAARAYKTNNNIVWRVAPSKFFDEDIWNVSLFMPGEDFPRDVSKVAIATKSLRSIHEKMTMKAVAGVLSEMRQMAEDLAMRSRT